LVRRVGTHASPVGHRRIEVFHDDRRCVQEQLQQRPRLRRDGSPCLQQRGRSREVIPSSTAATKNARPYTERSVAISTMADEVRTLPLTTPVDVA
jgi:hypothetical protein